MCKISYTGCLGLSPAILAQFTLKMRVAAQNSKKNYQNPLVWELKVIDVDISKKLLASACYDKQHVCAYLSYLQPFSRYASQ